MGARLVGVYAGGSLALGGYEPDRSDADVAVVVAAELAVETKEALVAAVRHEALPCPARKLELVVHSSFAAAAETIDACFELNLNTGARMPFRLDLEPDQDEALDRAILRVHGVPLLGPPAREVFGLIPRRGLLAVMFWPSCNAVLGSWTERHDHAAAGGEHVRPALRSPRRAGHAQSHR